MGWVNFGAMLCKRRRGLYTLMQDSMNFEIQMGVAIRHISGGRDLRRLLNRKNQLVAHDSRYTRNSNLRPRVPRDRPGFT